MVATPYEVAVVFENLTVAGKFITKRYSASDIPGEALILPSKSTSYTLPSGDPNSEDEIWQIKDVCLIGNFTDTHYIQIWLNEKNTDDIIINGINTTSTNDRQFKTITYIIAESTVLKLIQM